MQKWKKNLGGIELKGRHVLSKFKSESQSELFNPLHPFRNQTACVFSTDASLIGYKFGKDIDQVALYEKAQSTYGADGKPIVGSDFTVNDHNKLAQLAGSNEKIAFLDSSSSNNLLKSIINELNNGNPVGIMLQGHKEAVYGYEFSNDGFRLLTHDVGFWMDD